MDVWSLFWICLFAFCSVWAVCWMFVRRAEENVEYPTDPIAQRLEQVDNLDINEYAKDSMARKVLDMSGVSYQEYKSQEDVEYKLVEKKKADT